MRLAMESHTGGMPLCGLGAPETERVGATRSHDVEVGHTMGPPSERSHAASRNAITPRRSGLTTANRLRYPSSTEATPELFHGTRDTTLSQSAIMRLPMAPPPRSHCSKIESQFAVRSSPVQRAERAIDTTDRRIRTTRSVEVSGHSCSRHRASWPRIRRIGSS